MKPVYDQKIILLGEQGLVTMHHQQLEFLEINELWHYNFKNRENNINVLITEQVHAYFISWIITITLKRFVEPLRKILRWIKNIRQQEIK